MYLFYCLSNVFMAVRLYPDIPVRIVNILQWLYIGEYGMLNIMNVVCLGARIWRDIRGARIRFEKEIDIKEENLEIKNKVDKPVGEEVAKPFDLSTSFAYNNKSTNIPKSATATELAKPRYSQQLQSPKLKQQQRLSVQAPEVTSPQLKPDITSQQRLSVFSLD